MSLRVFVYFFDHVIAKLLLDVGFFLLPFFLQIFPMFVPLFACQKLLIILWLINCLNMHFPL